MMSDALLKETWKYADPHQDDRGLLLSNRIHELCEQGLLISKDYEKGNLRPASYTLRVGDDYVDSEGEKRSLSEEEDTIVFKKKSVIFVSTKEELELPFYIVARFNLRVNWVYDGILLGTGPQVDPGFAGVLSCPLYNLTNSDITIRRGEDFATIDFEKTTALIAKGTSPEEIKALITNATDKRTSQFKGETFSFYKVPRLKPLQLRKAHAIVSSLLEMREEVRTWRRLGVGSLVAFFGLTLSLLGFGANLYRQNTDLTKQITDGKNDIIKASEAMAKAQEKITKLEKDLDRLSSNAQPPIATSLVAPSKTGKAPSQKIP
jgi:deoxycytidine triphosphate deaminase